MQSPRRFRVMIVDDEPDVRETLSAFLVTRNFAAVSAGSAAEAASILARHRCDLVITDISMPDMSGLELLQQIKSSNPDVDVIMITGHLDVAYAIQAMRRGAYDFLTKPFAYEKLLLTIERVREKQELKNDAAQARILKREQQIAKETVLSLARVAEERDRGNLGHGKRVGHYAMRIGHRLCFTPERMETLRYGGILHDLGKIAIDDAILNKTGALSDPEYLTMKRHSEVGEYILKPSSIFRDVAPMVRWHHERWDGSGYPDGLAGDEIPLDARIICLVDYFDAVTSKRPYREPLRLAEALADIDSLKGSFFDPMLAEVFIDIMSSSEGAVSDSAAAAR